MASESAIRATHAALTLETLEALSNKGLVRRAQKDLEREGAGAVEFSGEQLTVTIGAFKVGLVEAGPAKASCSCPAAGVCQHILAACLHLMQSAPAAGPSDALARVAGERVREEWAALTEEEIVAHF